MLPDFATLSNLTVPPVEITGLAPGWGPAGVVRLGVGWQRAGEELTSRARGWLAPGWRRAGSWLAIGWIETFPSHELAGEAGVAGGV